MLVLVTTPAGQALAHPPTPSELFVVPPSRPRPPDWLTRDALSLLSGRDASWIGRIASHRWTLVKKVKVGRWVCDSAPTPAAAACAYIGRVSCLVFFLQFYNFIRGKHSSP